MIGTSLSQDCSSSFRRYVLITHTNILRYSTTIVSIRSKSNTCALCPSESNNPLTSWQKSKAVGIGFHTATGVTKRHDLRVTQSYDSYHTICAFGMQTCCTYKYPTCTIVNDQFPLPLHLWGLSSLHPTFLGVSDCDGWLSSGVSHTLLKYASHLGYEV
jgi:hypothetical protein